MLPLFEKTYTFLVSSSYYGIRKHGDESTFSVINHSSKTLAFQIQLTPVHPKLAQNFVGVTNIFGLAVC